MNDGAGNQYQYDAEGNVLSVNAGGSTAHYVYDALNQKVQGTTNGIPKEYMYDFAGRQTSSWTVSASSPTLASGARIYWENLLLAVRTDNGQTFFQHANWNNTERLRTNDQGQVAEWSYAQPFGDGYSESVLLSASDQDKAHFADLDHDTESNTDHAQFRQYSPTMGRWMSPDPYDGSYDPTNPQSFNRYTYVLNNPFSYMDPSGRQCTDTLEKDDAGNVTGVNTTCTVDGGGGGGVGPTSPSLCSLFPSLCGIGTGGGGGHLPITAPSDPVQGTSDPVVAPKNDPPKSPKRQACEANEVAFANRTRSDFLAGAGGRVLSDVKNGALGGGFSVGAGGLVAGPPGGAVGVFVGVVVGAAGAAIVGGFSEIGN